jgi:predicted dehydrogenase
VSKPLNIGVIGIGFGQQVHVPAFRLDNRCVVRAIAATDPDRARMVAGALGIPKACGDWGELIDDPAIDAVAIAVPPTEQAAIAIAAAKAGKHLFCEKPMAASTAEGRRMLKAADKAGVVHAMDLMFPEIPEWKQARELAHSGNLGRIRQVVLNWRVETYAYREQLVSWKTNKSEGGGVLNSFASHSLYYLEWLFGPITAIMARLHARKGGAESQVDILARFAAGMPGTLSWSADAFLGTGHRLEVYGDAGTMILENRTSDYARGFTLSLGTRQTGTLAPVPKKATAGQDSHKDGRIAGMQPIARRFVDAILKGGTVRPNLRDGLRTQLLLDAARVSHSKSEWREVGPEDSQS